MDRSTHTNVPTEMSEKKPQELPWFSDGLKFKCTGCGKCCTGAGGYVFLSQQDLNHLSERFHMEEKQFLQKYCRYVDGQYALLDKPNTDCIFLQDNRCSVYEDRPIQCRTFPWWIYNLRNIDDWNQAAERCEGVNHKDAPIVDALTIETQCLTYLDNLLDQNFDLPT